MKLKQLVVVVAFVQCCIDLIGITLNILCPFCTGITAFDQLQNDSPIVYEDTSWVTDKVTTFKDYSHIKSIPPMMYLLPHLWTGVIPRMMDGYKCIVSDQLVTEHLQTWTELVSTAERSSWDHIILSLSKLHKELPTKLHSLQKKLDSALEMRRTNCHSRSKSLIITELAFMGLSLGCCVVTICVTLFSKLAQLYLPWMIVTGYEIAGNVSVAITFLTSPGYSYLISLICFMKVYVLRWVFVHVIRKQMVFCIEQREKKAALQAKDDERRLLRSQLSEKGKIRLSRVFGTYS